MKVHVWMDNTFYVQAKPTAYSKEIELTLEEAEYVQIVMNEWKEVQTLLQKKWKEKCDAEESRRDG